jgi:hypothetical protein
MLLKLRTMGISVLGERNSALHNLVAEIPPAVVAQLLGCSDNCTQHHAQLAGPTLVPIRHIAFPAERADDEPHPSTVPS